MPFYECVFIVRQDVPVAQVEVLAKGFADIIDVQGGKVTKTEQCGLRNLTYRINKNKKGHYVLFNLDASPAAVAEMERNMRLHDDVLRYMTVSVEELEEGPSALVRREERSERPSFSGDRPRRPRESTDSNQGAAA